VYNDVIQVCTITTNALFLISAHCLAEAVISKHDFIPQKVYARLLAEGKTGIMMISSSMSIRFL